MKVTIEKIEVDWSEEPVVYWVTATAEDNHGPLYMDEFACAPNLWDIVRGVGEVASDVYQRIPDNDNTR